MDDNHSPTNNGSSSSWFKSLKDLSLSKLDYCLRFQENTNHLKLFSVRLFKFDKFDPEQESKSLHCIKNNFEHLSAKFKKNASVNSACSMNQPDLFSDESHKFILTILHSH